MATLNRTTSRKSYLLSVTPVDYSLTAGTNIPAPPESPPDSPTKFAPPPTLARGPLNSHPATPDNVSAAYPPTPGSEKENNTEAAPMSATKRDRTDSFRTPTSPASASADPHSSSSPKAQRKPSGVRKLLSLTNLRSSFGSSRTSLSLPRASNDTQLTNGIKRPSSPSMASTTVSSNSPRQHAREKKSGGNWFKRKSGMFMLNEDGTELDAVAEDSRPETRESKRFKESSPAPLLPEIGRLKGGNLGGGNLGWDEGWFKR